MSPLASNRPKEANVQAEEKDDKSEATPRGQARLPGMVPKRIKALQDQAEKVKDLQDERMSIAEEEQKARKVLLDIMKEHKVKRYPIDDDYVAEIEHGEEKAYVHKIRKGGKRVKAADSEKGD
jgi:hypothetical protein